jgi:GntR family transcriptional regulator
VAERVRDLIERDGLVPGTPLPSEAELQQRFGVSRATVRQALQELAFDGLVERRQGRGTFVAVAQLERALPELTSFSEHLASKGLASSSRLLRYDRLVRRGRRWARQAGAGPLPSPDAPSPSVFAPFQFPVVCVVRLRLANRTPVGIHTTLVPAEVAEAIGFTEERLRRDGRLSLYTCLEAGGYALDVAEEHLRARLFTRAEAELLGVDAKTAAMSVLRLTRHVDGRLLEAVRAVYLGDKYDYVVSLERSHARRR